MGEPASATMDGTPALESLPAAPARLLALASDLLGAVDPEGRLSYTSPGWAEAQGRAWVDLLAPEDRTAAAAALRCGADGLPARLGARPLMWTVRPEPDGGALVAGRDRSEAERLASELQEFAYIASHDLAEPLRMVTSYLDLLKRRYEGQLDETADEFIFYAVGGAQRMKGLIDGLLAYSRVGTHELRIADVDLAAVAEQVAGEDVSVEVPPLSVRADPVLIAQLLDHLVRNASTFRAADREPEVTVTAAAREGGTAVAVADRGIGIPEAQQERIFRPFARLHGPDDYPGAGMGLALCRRIADRHGATLSVRSQPGEGSVFELWIPA